MPLPLIEKRFCALQKKVLSFGPNRTVEVWPNSSAETNVWMYHAQNCSLERFRWPKVGKNGPRSYWIGPRSYWMTLLQLCIICCPGDVIFLTGNTAFSFFHNSCTMLSSSGCFSGINRCELVLTSFCLFKAWMVRAFIACWQSKHLTLSHLCLSKVNI